MLTDIWTVFWRDWVVLKHRMTAFILSRMVAPLLYLVAFGWGLGRSIQTANGASYIDFLVPGILALNSMNISFNSVTPVHAERVYHKSIEEYIIAPIRPYAYITGKVLAAVLRGLISSAIIIILAYAFGAHYHYAPLFTGACTELRHFRRDRFCGGHVPQHLRTDGAGQHLHPAAHVLFMRHLLFHPGPARRPADLYRMPAPHPHQLSAAGHWQRR